MPGMWTEEECAAAERSRREESARKDESKAHCALDKALNEVVNIPSQISRDREVATAIAECVAAIARLRYLCRVAVARELDRLKEGQR